MQNQVTQILLIFFISICILIQFFILLSFYGQTESCSFASLNIYLSGILVSSNTFVIAHSGSRNVKFQCEDHISIHKRFPKKLWQNH